MITAPDIAGQKYAVLGLGKSGLATAASLESSHADFIVWDDNPNSRAAAEKRGYLVKDLLQADLAGFQALILSPGIPHSYPKPHPVVERFTKTSLPIIGDIELLFRAQPKATYIGITGTNGKSTTTALIGHILKNASRRVQVGGNLGTPALSLEPLGEGGIYVLELSSYQLELIEKNVLDIAVLLNITPDHLDRHGGMEGYIAAKQRIIRSSPAQKLVIGTDDPETRRIMEQTRKQDSRPIAEISVEHPVSQGVMAAGQQMFAYENEEGRPIVAFNALPTLPGKHNWQNACAAFAACHFLGLPKAEIVAGLKSFPGLAHRQQFVAEIEGVRFINDSKATNADATSKALACYTDIYWILGGRPKEGGLSGLERFAPHIRHAFLMGEATDTFAAWCAQQKLPSTRCGTLDVATTKAAMMAWHDKLPAAVVLLSPACASWDQFANFEERGELFVRLTKALEAEENHAKAV